MATLCLGDVECSTPVLREWLAGDWGLVFSHPKDFQYQGLEDDRWLQILRDEFRAAGVRPLACARAAADTDVSWTSQLMCDQGFVRLDQGVQAAVDLPARSLRDDLLSMPARFVMIIDDCLRRRGVLEYVTGCRSISALDLLASIVALRRRSSLPRAA